MNDSEILTVQHDGKTWIATNPQIESRIDPGDGWKTVGPFLVFELREVSDERND